MTSKIIRVALIAAVAAASLSVAACQPKTEAAADASSAAPAEEMAADSTSADTMASEAAAS